MELKTGETTAKFSSEDHSCQTADAVNMSQKRDQEETAPLFDFNSDEDRDDGILVSPLHAAGTSNGHISELATDTEQDTSAGHSKTTAAGAAPSAHSPNASLPKLDQINDPCKTRGERNAKAAQSEQIECVLLRSLALEWCVGILLQSRASASCFVSWFGAI
jgi:hypothetical protein